MDLRGEFFSDHLLTNQKLGLRPKQTDPVMSKRPIGDDSSHTNGATKKAKLYGTKPTISEILINSRVVLSQLPEVPTDLDHTNVLEWATLLQKVVEQFNLHISCISAATYKWGSDRTGAGDQHLQTLSSELMNAQEQVSANVSERSL